MGIAPGTPAAQGDVTVPRDGDPAKLARTIAELGQHATDARSQIALAEAHFVMAESIAVLGWKDQGDARAHFAESAKAAGAALETTRGTTQLRVEGASVITTEDAAALYWLAASGYAVAQLDGFSALVQTQASLRGVLSEVARLAPHVDRGGAHRLLATVAAHPVDPSLRDLKLAREHAQAALAVDGSAASNWIAFIDHYAVPAQDRVELDDKLRRLNELKSASDDAVAALRAGQTVATIEERLE